MRNKRVSAEQKAIGFLRREIELLQLRQTRLEKDAEQRPSSTGERSYTVHLTGDEVQALLGGLVFVNTYFGAKPDPPTPEMRVQAKLEQALERDEEAA